MPLPESRCVLLSCRRVGVFVYVLSLAAFAVSAHANDNLTLAKKARVFQIDLVERFLREGQLRVRRRLPTTEHPYVTYNMSDTAYMTGLYCAASTWR